MTLAHKRGDIVKRANSLNAVAAVDWWRRHKQGDAAGIQVFVVVHDGTDGIEHVELIGVAVPQAPANIEVGQICIGF